MYEGVCIIACMCNFWKNGPKIPILNETFLNKRIRNININKYYINTPKKAICDARRAKTWIDTCSRQAQKCS